MRRTGMMTIILILLLAALCAAAGADESGFRPQDLPDRISLSCTLESGEQMMFPVEVR